MKKVFLTLAAMTVLTAPSMANSVGGGGFIYDDSTTPGFATAQTKVSSKIGCATCLNVWHLVQTGECGINDAMKAGGIKQMHHFDVQTKTIIGVKKQTVMVYGE